MTSSRTREPAPHGYLWVCGACGKTAVDPYEGRRGWDISCFLNARLEKVEHLQSERRGSRDRYIDRGEGNG